MTASSKLPETHSTDKEDEMSLFDLLIVLAKHSKLILGLPLAAAVIAAGYSLTLPDIFTATSRILPPQQSQSTSSALLAQLGGGVAGLVGGVGKNPSDIYVAMLKSRTVANNIIQRFGLMKLWEVDSAHPSDAFAGLAGITRITSEPDGTITIAVDNTDTKRAANLANAYVEELMKFTSVLAVTEASQRRLFFERQFTLAKDDLAKAEAAARQALQTGGLVKVDDQGRAMVEASARLRGQITVKEVQISAMRTFAADRNPDLQLAQQELASLKFELAKVEGTGDTKSAKYGSSAPGSESLRLLRDVKYREVIFELLARQFEMAKIDEAKDSSVIQIMDAAIEPDRKSKPRRSLIVLVSALAALFVAIVWALVLDAVVRGAQNPDQAARLNALKQHLSWR